MDFTMECMGLIIACESYMDALEIELAMEAALEAEGEEDGATAAASGIGAKLRAAFGKLRKGDKEGAEEAAEAAEELAEAADEAETPEEKKKLSTAAKVGMAAAAAAAAAAGMYALGKKFEKSSKQEGASDPKAAARLLMGFARKGDQIADAARDAGYQTFTTDGRADKLSLKRLKHQEKAASGPHVSKEWDKTEKVANKLRDTRRLARARKQGYDDRLEKKRNAIKTKYGKKDAAEESVLGALAFGLEGYMSDEEEYNDQIVAEAFELMEACEAFMDALELELATEAAMEAEGEEGSEGGQAASGIGAKLRAAFGKLRKGDKAGAKEAAEAAEELAEAADEAETPEEKKKLTTAAKIGLAAAATAATAAGMYALGKKFENSATKPGASDPKAISKALINFASRGDAVINGVKDSAHYNLTASGREDKAFMKQRKAQYAGSPKAEDLKKKREALMKKNAAEKAARERRMSASLNKYRASYDKKNSKAQESFMDDYDDYDD